MHNIGDVKNVENFRTAFAKNEEQTNLLTSYTEYKQRLDFELQKQAESFVKVGYLLKVARDTNVLAESGYKTVAEFAQAEYGLSKDMVSRYIAINDRYSEDGYSDQLQDKYEGYGYSKLTEMLTLPEEIITEIKPTLTRKEIQEIKKEVAEEEKISPMEVALEAAEAPKKEKKLSQTQEVWFEFFRNNKDVFLKLKAAIENMSAESFTDIMAPSGNAILFTRVPGVGKIMITVDGEKDPVVMTNVRDLAKEEQTVKEALEDLNMLFGQTITKKAWERVYGEAFDEEKAKNDEKPQKTEENSDQQRKNESKPAEERINKPEKIEKKTKEPAPKEEAPAVVTCHATKEQAEELKKIMSEQAAGFMPEPVKEIEPGTLGHLEVVKEEVAPVQQDRVIEVREEIDIAKFAIDCEADVETQKKQTSHAIDKEYSFMKPELVTLEEQAMADYEFSSVSKATRRDWIWDAVAAAQRISEHVHNIELLERYLTELEEKEAADDQNS